MTQTTLLHYVVGQVPSIKTVPSIITIGSSSMLSRILECHIPELCEKEFESLHGDNLINAYLTAYNKFQNNPVISAELKIAVGIPYNFSYILDEDRKKVRNSLKIAYATSPATPSHKLESIAQLESDGDTILTLIKKLIELPSGPIIILPTDFTKLDEEDKNMFCWRTKTYDLESLAKDIENHTLRTSTQQPQNCQELLEAYAIKKEGWRPIEQAIKNIWRAIDVPRLSG